jgi:NAD(P)-dependent dehydrogenase (short-subunit alcohol dehydrogenase family)
MGVGEAAYEEYLKKASNLHPIGRVGSVDDTSRAIAFLASNEHAAFITGTLLAVDGGRVSMSPQ